jgi:NhaP-type Na+/H+ or K+/H+ antiporter
VTPTDPVLANSICKGEPDSVFTAGSRLTDARTGRFAEKHVPLHVRNIIVAESGANDGLGFPFLYMGLYLILIRQPNHSLSVGYAIGEWLVSFGACNDYQGLPFLFRFYNIILYQVCLSIILGAIIGYVARRTLRFAEDRK